MAVRRRCANLGPRRHRCRMFGLQPPQFVPRPHKPSQKTESMQESGQTGLCLSLQAPRRSDAQQLAHDHAQVMAGCIHLIAFAHIDQSARPAAPCRDRLRRPNAMTSSSLTHIILPEPKHTPCQKYFFNGLLTMATEATTTISAQPTILTFIRMLLASWTVCQIGNTF